MTDPDSWPFDDDRADRRAAIAFAMMLDRARKREGKRTMARLRFRRLKPKPQAKGQ